MIKKKIGFIINPIAGGKKKGFLKEKIFAEFKVPDFTIEVLYTDYPGHATEIATRWVQEEFSVIVAVGGDGTINEVARSLMEQDAALGIIPFGSGNGFARHFGFPLRIDQSIKVLKKGISRKIDVGMVDGIPFFCTSGLGFDAETGYQFSHFGKRGFFSYAFSIMRVFQNYKPSSYNINIEGDSFVRDAFFINVANISQYGYNFKIAPQASTEDGKLDLVIVNKFPKWIGIGLTIQSYFGRIQNNSYVEHYHGKKIEISTSEKNPHIHIDGEPGLGTSKLKFTVKPACLKVILPHF